MAAELALAASTILLAAAVLKLRTASLHLFRSSKEANVR